MGPGVVMAGSSIGAGEWLFGPAVTAQYGATLLWLGSVSILLQVFVNLEVMRYALYCGEPIHVGYCRTWPGRRVWLAFYVVLEFTAIWPFMASNAAVPLAAALLGHLPGDAAVTFMGFSLSERMLVKVLGYGIFLGAFLPLIFGGTVYRMIERIMTTKLVVVLGFLTFVAIFMVSWRNVGEVLSGFFRIGSVPLRAGTVVVGPHFTLTERQGERRFTVKGTLEDGRPLVTRFVVHHLDEVEVYKLGQPVPSTFQERFDAQVARARALAERGGFFVQDEDDTGRVLTVEGEMASGRWIAQRFEIHDSSGTRQYSRLDDVPSPWSGRFRQWLDHQGLERVNLLSYARAHGRLPDLDWALLAGLAAIAGAGGLVNSLFSNYSRDKGWGMGARVGAIPSAVGGRTITLSHVGRTFDVDAASRKRWRGWFRLILRDQALWIVCCFVGMALPCMLSLEFIRHAPVSGERVAAMSADGIASRYPAFGFIFWPLTLLISFLVLAPNQIQSSDNVARRWSDILWTTSARARRMGVHQVRYVYYSILTLYCVWGLTALAFFDPLQIAKIGTVLMNVGLGASALHTIYVNRTLLPRELRPNWFMQLGLVCCGLFFFGITAIVVASL